LENFKRLFALAISLLVFVAKKRLYGVKAATSSKGILTWIPSNLNKDMGHLGLISEVNADTTRFEIVGTEESITQVPNEEWHPSLVTMASWNAKETGLFGWAEVQSLFSDEKLIVSKKAEEVEDHNRRLDARKEERAVNRRTRSLRARVESYITSFLLVVYKKMMPEGLKVRTRYTRFVSLSGLLHRMYPDLPMPSVQLKNDMPADEQRDPLPIQIHRAVARDGHMLVNRKHIVHRELVPLLAKTFPKAIDFRAYVKGLCAPLVANGHSKVEIRFVHVRHGRKSAGADGSGRIHPNHPLYAQLGYSGHGPRPCIQIRMWNPELGCFVKGILVPSEAATDVEGNPEIQVDWLQIKGLLKDTAKAKHKRAAAKVRAGEDLHTLEMAEEKFGTYESQEARRWLDEGRMVIDLGVTNVFDKVIRYSWCFEILERVKDTPRMREILREWVEEAYAKLTFEKLLDSACAQSDNVAFARKLCKRLGVDPLSLRFIMAQVQKALGQKLWLIAQGAGKKGDGFVSILDSTLEPGTCVLPSIMNGKQRVYKPGSVIGITRFPMVLPQGLRTLTVVEPSEHHLLKTEDGMRHVPNAIWLHGDDLEIGMQGDDDGDVVIVNADPRVVEFYKERISLLPGKKDAMYLIEPVKGENKGNRLEELHSLSVDGRALIAKDGRGPVGLSTFWSGAFLAIGKRVHGLAMAHLTQEYIDCAKRIPMWTDPRKASNPSNYEEVRPGIWKIKAGNTVDIDWADEDGMLNQEKVTKWVQKQLGMKLNDILSWRQPGGAKSIIADSWDMPDTPKGNLVHYCARTAFEVYQQWAHDQMEEGRVDQVWPNEHDGPVLVTKRPMDSNLATLVVDALSAEGFDMSGVEALAQDRYMKTLREKSGLNEFAKGTLSIMKAGLDVEEKARQMDAIRAILAGHLSMLSIEELATIWVTELSQRDESGNIPDRAATAAFRAVCWEGSPVLVALDLEASDRCSFAAENMDAIMSWLQQRVDAGQNGNLFHALAETISASVKHLEVTGVELHKCKDCTTLMEGRVVSEVRKTKGSDAEAVVKDIMWSINRELGWPTSRHS